MGSIHDFFDAANKVRNVKAAEDAERDARVKVKMAAAHKSGAAINASPISRLLLAIQRLPPKNGVFFKSDMYARRDDNREPDGCVILKLSRRTERSVLSTMEIVYGTEKSFIRYSENGEKARDESPGHMAQLIGAWMAHHAPDRIDELRLALPESYTTLQPGVYRGIKLKPLTRKPAP